MKRFLIVLSSLFLLAVVSYFVWSFREKDLKSVPVNADAVVLIDVKAVSEQYVLTLVKHPSLWFKTSKISGPKNGIEIPDFIQIFHLKDTSYKEWYSVFQITEKAALLHSLKEKGFVLTKNKLYTKDQISVKVGQSSCVIGFSANNFESRTTSILTSGMRNLYADQLINNSVASVSYLAKTKIHNFAVYLNDHDVEIKSKTTDDYFSSVITKLDNTVSFLKADLDAENTRKFSKIFNKNLSDSVQITNFSAVANLESVNDTIISYSYDDNFNEVEKVSYQNIVQPFYQINIQSGDSEKLWSYFQQKAWINAQNQFTPIPFQPNTTTKNAAEITIESKGKEVIFGEKLSGNYIFIKNNPLLLDSFKSISASEKKKIGALDFLFYGNKGDYHYLKLNFKKEKLPLILR